MVPKAEGFEVAGAGVHEPHGALHEHSTGPKGQSTITSANKLLALPAAALLLIALLPLPYGYFTFLRLAVTVSALLLAYREYHTSAALNAFAVLFIAVALLFNPIFPVHLSKTVWQTLDILTAGAFAGWYWVRRN